MKFEYNAKDHGLIWYGDTWAGFIRPCRDGTGRWKHRWVQLPWFGWKVSKKVRVRRLNGNTVKTRTQKILRIWAPWILIYHSCNVHDLVEISGSEELAKRKNSMWRSIIESIIS